MTGRIYFKTYGINLKSLTIEMICRHLQQGCYHLPAHDIWIRNLRSKFLHEVSTGKTELDFREWLLIQEGF